MTIPAEETVLMARRIARSILTATACAAFAAISPIAAAQPVLKFATALPPNYAMVTELFQVWAKKVADASGGELAIQTYGTTLANASNVWERTVDGVADIGFGIHGAAGVPFPKTVVTSLPFLVDDLPAGSVALWRLYANGLIAEEHKDVKVLAFITTPAQGITAKKPIHTLADLKGVKIRSADRIVADIATALGATPISVPAQETYQALSSGVVQATFAGWTLINSFKLYEQAQNHLESALGSPPGYIIMNKQAYEKLSPKAKAAIDQNSGEVYSRAFGEWFQNDAAKGREFVRKLPNQNVYSLSAAEAERWKQATAPVIKAWIDRTPGGDKVIDAFRAELKKQGR
jgi:TRAP-type C4-dicarboxylate transport system substrate-binding protein